jgi:Zn-dependent peptidase ImmA (M78 family)
MIYVQDLRQELYGANPLYAAKLIRSVTGQSPYNKFLVNHCFEKIGGLDVIIESESWNIVGRISEKSGNYTVNVRNQEHATRLRFIVTHMLGHIFMSHDNCRDEIDKHIHMPGRHIIGDEEKANQFAAELFLPRESFLDVGGTFNFDATKIAQHFGTSITAVQVKMNSIVYG